MLRIFREKERNLLRAEEQKFRTKQRDDGERAGRKSFIENLNRDINRLKLV